METDIYDLSYNDIMYLPEPMRTSYLNEFECILATLPSEVQSRHRSLSAMLMEAEVFSATEIGEVSQYAFPGETVRYYSHLSEHRVKKPFTCAVSSDVIGIGNYGIIYKPFFYLPLKKEVYVLNKSIRAHYYYRDFFPTDMQSFDDFSYKVDHSYELGLDEYYSFSSNVGGFSLRKLKRR